MKGIRFATFLLVLVLALTASFGVSIHQVSALSTVTVSPFSMGNWVISNFDNSLGMATGDTVTASGTDGDFMSGPGTPPLGSGSFHQEVGTDGNDATRLMTTDFDGTALTTLTDISYSTYVTVNAGGQATYIQLRIDLDGNGSTDDILFFEPVYQNGTYSALPYSGVVPNQCLNPLCVVLNTWQTWDADAGGWWSATDSAGGPPLTTLAGYAANYPGAKLATDAPAFRLTVGFGAGAWDNFDGNFDNLTVNGTTYDFEVTPQCSFTTVGTTMTLNGDCFTDTTITVPNGFTLDGNGYSITAVDPSSGHFLGAVIKNGGATAHVTNLTVTASGLANVCDGGNDRLRGILFDGAGGSITNNTVVDINQGASGCQEGNGIEIRNEPFDDTGTDLAVTISGNTVTNYQKNGITANGSVAVTMMDNDVTGAGPVNYIAQNGIQIGFGGTAIIQNNTVSGNNYTPADTVACGILYFEADGVKTSKNTRFDNERDQCNFGKGGGTYNPSP